MTNQEAIDVIQGYRLESYMNNTKRLPACDMAIDALQKNMVNDEAVSAVAKANEELVAQIELLKQQLSKAMHQKYKIGDRFITYYGEPSTLTEIQENKEGVCYFMTDDATPYMSDSYGELDLDEFKRLT